MCRSDAGTQKYTVLVITLMSAPLAPAWFIPFMYMYMALQFLVDTTRPHDPEGADARVPVFLAYMRSYTNMGKAAYACVSGCTCEPKTYDAHHTEKVGIVGKILASSTGLP